MARPARTNVDYFPFLVKEGKAMHYIETTYGNDGYATWVKLLRELAVANNHYLNLWSKIDLMFLASKCNIPKELLLKIIDDLSDLEEIDASLWKECKVIWNQKFVDHIQDAYSKRNNECINIEGLRILLSGLGILLSSYNTVLDVNNTQSKVKYSKVKKSKEEQYVLDFPFESEIFKNAWNHWIEYKKTQFNFKYKTAETEQFALNDLLKISLGSEIKALEIIQNAIAKGWKGLYAIKSNEVPEKKETGRFSVNEQTIQNVIRMKQEQQDQLKHQG